MDSVVNLLFYTQVCYLVLLLTSARLVCRSVFYQNKSINFVKIMFLLSSLYEMFDKRSIETAAVDANILSHLKCRVEVEHKKIIKRLRIKKLSGENLKLEIRIFIGVQIRVVKRLKFEYGCHEKTRKGK